MDRRRIERMNLKFGKFLDPVLMLAIILVFVVSLLSVRNLTPRTFSQEMKETILGITEPNKTIPIKLILGEHAYITQEILTTINDHYFKYTAFVKKPLKGRVSKPIIEIQNSESMKVQIQYINSNSSKIAIFQESKSTNHILQENNKVYMPEITFDQEKDTLYLSIENTKSVLFDQYVEIDFFLNP
jgi:hypothetical protein